MKFISIEFYDKRTLPLESMELLVVNKPDVVTKILGMIKKLSSNMTYKVA